MTDIAVLNHAEQVALDECERVIGDGIKTFVAVGSALSFVRDNNLYRGTHPTFELYARERWNISRPRAYELMTAADVVSAIADTGQPAPENEGQARELAKVPGPERADVWRETVERTNGKPTAAAVRAVQAERTQTPGPADKASPVDPGVTPAPAVEAAVLPREPDPQAAVAAALDAHVPDLGAAERAWRSNFYAAIKAPHELLLRLNADEIARYADEQDVQTLRLLVDGFTDLGRRVTAARSGNVRQLRRVQ